MKKETDCDTCIHYVYDNRDRNLYMNRHFCEIKKDVFRDYCRHHKYDIEHPSPLGRMDDDGL